jgi:neutral ceramidase
MKKFLVVLILLNPFFNYSNAKENLLKVGTACVDVTPTVFPIQLRSGKSNLIHDPLHVRAVAFERDESRAVICLIDAIGIGREMSDLAKSRAAEKTGWKVEEMLICATHTHTAPKGGTGMPG